MRQLAAAGLVLAGLIHLLPLSGLLGADALQRLYGVAVDDPDLVLLLRHRALLFGLLGAGLVAAAFRPAWQRAAVVAGLVSVIGFLVLAWLQGGYGAAIARVVWADVVALAGLLVAAVHVTRR